MTGKAVTKSDRALALYESGISPAAIAERLGTTRENVHGMVRQARERRAKKVGEVEA